MKTRRLVLFTAAVLLISTVSVAQPNQQQKNRRQTNPERAEVMKKQFDERRQRMENFFTDEQKEAMKNLRLESSKQMKPLKNQLRELMARQQTLTTADLPDMDAINSNIDKMAEIKAEMAKIQAKQHQEFRKLLTEEQLLGFDARKGKQGRKPRGEFRQQRSDFERNRRFDRGA
jgi:Spy/CpxP family protein refolding chaperone